MVAALVKGEEGDDNWILAEVVGWNAALAKYEVDDIDEEQKERHVLSRRRVIPLPQMRADPVTCPEALHPTGSTGLLLLKYSLPWVVVQCLDEGVIGIF